MLRICMLWILLLPLGHLYAESGSASRLDSALVANGYARYSELGSDFYVGALFMRIPSSDPEVIRGVADKRMEFKILGGMSHRRFAQLLVKGSAINNKPQLLVENAKAMEAFLGGLKGNLNHGDHVVFAPTKGGLSLSVNSVELVAVEAPGLLNVLLNIWIGDVPPSRDFKSRMLGLTSPLEYQGDFDFLKYSPLRASEIKAWKAASAAPVQNSARERRLQSEQAAVAGKNRVVNQGVTVKEGRVAQASTVARAGASSGVQAAQRGRVESLNASVNRSPEQQRSAIHLTSGGGTLLERPAAEQHMPLAENALDAVAAEAEVAMSPASATPELEADQSIEVAKRVAAVSKDAVFESPVSEGPVPEVMVSEADRLAEEKAISAEDVLNEQFYANKLLLHSQQKMRYPEFSRRMGQEGTIIVSVTIDRKGTLVDFVLTEASEYSPLNEAVKKGITQSEPFPQIPEKIPGNTFTFVVPVTFKITS